MSLHAAAQKLAKKGRGQDKALVHMSPRELQGLQALAKAKGGSLTINPDTGLPEAGFLEDILPIVATAAATYFTGGAAAAALGPAGFGLGATTAGILGGAGAGALIGGASSAIQGGDFGTGALMGGAGGALGGAMGAFTPGAESAAGSGLKATTTGGAPGLSAATPTAPLGPAAPTTAATVNAPLAQATTVGVNPIGVNSATGMGIDPLASNVPASYNITPNTPVTSTTMAARDTANAILNPNLAAQTQPSVTQAATQTGGGIGDWWNKQSPLEKAGYSTAGALGIAALNAPPRGLPTNDEEESTLKRISPNFRGQQPIRPNPYYRAQYPVYAGGGIVALAAGGGPVERMSMMDMQSGMYPQGMLKQPEYATPNQRPAAMQPISSGYDTPVNSFTGVGPQFARGGIADLGGYSDGGRMLKGPGDGMSDSIPGVIGGRQPARLADGEFVVPADVVSHLGNGSTDAGAKKLYAMMDKVRQARTGKKKQAPAVKTEKYLPA